MKQNLRHTPSNPRRIFRRTGARKSHKTCADESCFRQMQQWGKNFLTHAYPIRNVTQNGVIIVMVFGQSSVVCPSVVHGRPLVVRRSFVCRSFVVVRCRSSAFVVVRRSLAFVGVRRRSSLFVVVRRRLSSFVVVRRPLSSIVVRRRPSSSVVVIVPLLYVFFFQFCFFFVRQLFRLLWPLLLFCCFCVVFWVVFPKSRCSFPPP